MSNVDKTFFLKYISSFSDGRIRIRHSSLKDAHIVKELDEEIKKVKGIDSTEFNTRTGSLLLHYNTKELSTEKLIELALPWAEKLEDASSSTQKIKAENLGENKKNTKNNWWSVSSQVFNASLLGSFSLCLLGLVSKRIFVLHTVGGIAFTLLTIPHVYKYKNRIPLVKSLP